VTNPSFLRWFCHKEMERDKKFQTHYIAVMRKKEEEARRK
jgi:hypothetical protein